jgi:hypothetical protein
MSHICIGVENGVHYYLGIGNVRHSALLLNALIDDHIVQGSQESVVTFELKTGNVMWIQHVKNKDQKASLDFHRMAQVFLRETCFQSWVLVEHGERLVSYSHLNSHAPTKRLCLKISRILTSYAHARVHVDRIFCDKRFK